MAKNEFAGMMEEYRKSVKRMDFAKIQIQSNCPHHSKTDRHLTVTHVTQSAETANLKGILVKCISCLKLITMNKMSEEEMDAHLNAIDSMCDIIKMRADLQNEKDVEAYKKAAKLQLAVRTFLKPAYQTAIKTNKKNRNKSGDYNGVTINKPVIR